MKTLARVLVASALVMGMGAPAATSQAKIRIALWDFENNAERSWWFYNDMGPAARNQIDTAFSENAKLSELFAVVERQKLAMVMKEQGLAQTGAVDPQQAARVGKILGVQYIVTGGIDKFTINTTRGAGGVLGGIGGSYTTANATINLRFIDTTTAARVISVSAEGQVKKGGGSFRGNSLSREAEWGIASETIEKASKAVAEKLVTGGYLDKVSAAAGTSAGAVDMRVIKVDGKRAYINVGSSGGVKVGDKFVIIHRGEELIDPATGMKLGAEEKQTGQGTVVSVQERFSIIEFTGTAAASDVIRKG
jgi:curli biogenesis system outer membrane secretion channel CsgG